MKVYITEKSQHDKNKPVSSGMSTWCMGHVIGMKRSAQEILDIQHKWNARKQQRVLNREVKSDAIHSSKKL